MKKILVTGASGFIGRHALPLLIKKGYEVHAVSMEESHEGKGIEWHQANLLNAEARKDLIKRVKPNSVLHFAWIATPGIYWTSPLNEDWKTATLDLLALAKEYGVKRFVGAGSSAEYDWSTGECDELKTPLNPSTPYGKAKAETGKAVIEANDGISTAWGRIFFLYGPYEYPERLVPSVICSLLKNEKAKCTHGKQIRDFLYVQDVASAFVALLESTITGAVNIASGTPVSIKEVVTTIAAQLKKEKLVAFGAIKSPENDPKSLTASIDRLQNEVQWKPKHSLEAGLKTTIQWWKENF